MDLQQELAALGRYAALDRLLELTRRPLSHLPESSTHLIPSFVMGEDGPTLARLLLVSTNFICDVLLTGDHRNVFDYVAKDTIRNYRFQVWDQEIKRDDQISVIFQIADIQLLHGDISGSQFVTQLQYAGEQRDEWIQMVLEAIPITVIMQRVRG